jgi:hypothetical protein
VFRQEEIINDYVKIHLRHEVEAIIEKHERGNSKSQSKWNIFFLVVTLCMLGLFLFEGYIVYKGYSVVIEMQESYKKALGEWYAIPNYKTDKKVDNERRAEK